MLLHVHGFSICMEKGESPVNYYKGTIGASRSLLTSVLEGLELPRFLPLLPPSNSVIQIYQRSLKNNNYKKMDITISLHCLTVPHISDFQWNLKMSKQNPSKSEVYQSLQHSLPSLHSLQICLEPRIGKADGSILTFQSNK